MEVVNVNVDKLNEAEYNPRKLTDKQKEDIKKSLETFGFVNPLVVNKHKGRENVLVGGHQRLKVAKDLGFKEVPVVFVDLDETQEKELNVRLNKNTGDWDLDVLGKEFSKLDLEDWGFDDEETSVIFTNVANRSMLEQTKQVFNQQEVDLEFSEDLIKEMVVIVFYDTAKYIKYRQLQKKYDGQEADFIYNAIIEKYEQK